MRFVLAHHEHCQPASKGGKEEEDEKEQISGARAGQRGEGAGDAEEMAAAAPEFGALCGHGALVASKERQLSSMGRMGRNWLHGSERLRQALLHESSPMDLMLSQFRSPQLATCAMLSQTPLDNAEPSTGFQILQGTRKPLRASSDGSAYRQLPVLDGAEEQLLWRHSSAPGPFRTMDDSVARVRGGVVLPRPGNQKRRREDKCDLGADESVDDDESGSMKRRQ